jgi:hypothetical protein
MALRASRITPEDQPRLTLSARKSDGTAIQYACEALEHLIRAAVLLEASSLYAKDEELAKRCEVASKAARSDRNQIADLMASRPRFRFGARRCR